MTWELDALLRNALNNTLPRVRYLRNGRNPIHTYYYIDNNETYRKSYANCLLNRYLLFNSTILLSTTLVPLWYNVLRHFAIY